MGYGGKSSRSFGKKQRGSYTGSSSRGSGKPRGGFGDGPSFRSGNRSSRLELTTVTCAACGKKTEVPFRPTGDKPVYCRECFQSNPRQERPMQNRQERREKSFPSSDEFEQINRKLDKILQKLDID